MKEMVGDAVAERMDGGRVGPLKAFVVAAVVGFAAAVAAYRLLRSG